ncbi:MAG: hypothetical protein V7K50_07795 [Nostoc sp.]|uniref:hypothetical protein n=1 Tax=Nostoc sp. TaxID=1180 RepID=UPI002FFCCCC4
MNKTNSEILEQFRTAADGLLMMSESDYIEPSADIGSGESIGYFLRNIASTINYDNFSDLPKAERYLEDWEMEKLADAAKVLGGQYWLVLT